MTDTPNLFSLVLDLEATGLDERHDDIVEVGVIGVDADYNVLFEFERVVRPGMVAFERMMENDFVRRMHEPLGFETRSLNDFPLVYEVEQEILQLVRDWAAPDTKPLLSGSGVGHYDMRFLRRHMPALLEALMHRPNDVGSAREEFRRVNGFDLVDANGQKTHRAIEDAHCHLVELRAFRDAYKQLGDLIRQHPTAQEAAA